MQDVAFELRSDGSEHFLYRSATVQSRPGSSQWMQRLTAMASRTRPVAIVPADPGTPTSPPPRPAGTPAPPPPPPPPPPPRLGPPPPRKRTRKRQAGHLVWGV